MYNIVMHVYLHAYFCICMYVYGSVMCIYVGISVCMHAFMYIIMHDHDIACVYN